LNQAIGFPNKGPGAFSQEHRIIEALRLEKTSKIIKSSCHASTTMPAKPNETCHKVHEQRHWQSQNQSHRLCAVSDRCPEPHSHKSRCRGQAEPNNSHSWEQPHSKGQSGSSYVFNTFLLFFL